MSQSGPAPCANTVGVGPSNISMTTMLFKNCLIGFSICTIVVLPRFQATSHGCCASERPELHVSLGDHRSEGNGVRRMFQAADAGAPAAYAGADRPTVA